MKLSPVVRCAIGLSLGMLVFLDLTGMHSLSPRAQEKTPSSSLSPMALLPPELGATADNIAPTNHLLATNSFNCRQLTYQIVEVSALGLPGELRSNSVTEPPSVVVPRRRIPEQIRFAELSSPGLSKRAVPLPEANTLAHVNYYKRRFGRLQIGVDRVLLFNPEIILVKFLENTHVAALRVEPMRESDAVRALAERQDVQFAELDVYQNRAFIPNDSQITNQWHHQVIGSFQAWEKSLGQPFVRIAIVDSPFQMDHPDLAPHTDSGWDVVNNTAVTSNSGIDHSTLGAGMAAAVIGNNLGVAGACNCRILPITINGALSEMYNAVVWAADHGVRVVNISWTGANSDTVNASGSYLKNKTRGILAMPGVNGTGFLDYTNQPDIYCISMTDAADNMRSRFGNHIDFAAPGWGIFSTTTGSGYGTDSGTSYATPLFCGVVALLFSINPTLSADEAIEILKGTADDKGQPGWDQFFGWGRINFAAAANAAAATLPVITEIRFTNQQAAVSTQFKTGINYGLWKAPRLENGVWTPVTNAVTFTNGTVITLTDPSADRSKSFYRIEVAVP